MASESDVRDTIRQRVRYYRVLNGLSVRKLSKLSGVADNTIFRLEGPDYGFIPSLSTLMAIANALNISLCDLLEGL